MSRVRYFRNCAGYVVAAHPWFKNGDHPNDSVWRVFENTGIRPTSPREGLVVRRCNIPSGDMKAADAICGKCGNRAGAHGWIDNKRGQTVCPGDWIAADATGYFVLDMNEWRDMTTTGITTDSHEDSMHTDLATFLWMCHHTESADKAKAMARDILLAVHRGVITDLSLPVPMAVATAYQCAEDSVRDAMEEEAAALRAQLKAEQDALAALQSALANIKTTVNNALAPAKESVNIRKTRIGKGCKAATATMDETEAATQSILNLIDEQEDEEPIDTEDMKQRSRIVNIIKNAASTCGWSVGVHGSLRRDIDLIAVPWTARALPIEAVLDNIMRFTKYVTKGDTLTPPRDGGRRSILLFHPDAVRVDAPDAPKGTWNPPAIDLSFVDGRYTAPLPAGTRVDTAAFVGGILAPLHQHTTEKPE